MRFTPTLPAVVEQGLQSQEEGLLDLALPGLVLASLVMHRVVSGVERDESGRLAARWRLLCGAPLSREAPGPAGQQQRRDDDEASPRAPRPGPFGAALFRRLSQAQTTPSPSPSTLATPHWAPRGSAGCGVHARLTSRSEGLSLRLKGDGWLSRLVAVSLGREAQGIFTSQLSSAF